MIKEIEKINKEIDALMQRKVKEDAQKEVYEKRLIESITSYNNEYGTDISGNSLEEICKSIEKEIRVVEAKTSAELEKSKKIIALINTGDIKGAEALLGIVRDDNPEEEKVVSSEDSVKPPVNDIPSVNQEIPVEAIKKSKMNMQSAFDVVSEVESDIKDDDFFSDSSDDWGSFNSSGNVGSKNSIKEEKKVSEQPKKISPFSFIDEDEEEEEDEFISPSSSGKSVAFEEDEDFGGFGNILKGSKFKL